MLQVACEVGYDSEAAFNRAFKREFSIPPGQFRKAMRRTDPSVAGGRSAVRIPVDAV